jgi:hypothetical protein
MRDAFRDGFEQCKAQLIDLLDNPALKNRTEIKAALLVSKPFDDEHVTENEIPLQDSKISADGKTESDKS